MDPAPLVTGNDDATIRPERAGERRGVSRKGGDYFTLFEVPHAKGLGPRGRDRAFPVRRLHHTPAYVAVPKSVCNSFPFSRSLTLSMYSMGFQSFSLATALHSGMRPFRPVMRNEPLIGDSVGAIMIESRTRGQTPSRAAAGCLCLRSPSALNPHA